MELLVEIMKEFMANFRRFFVQLKGTFVEEFRECFKVEMLVQFLVDFS